MTILVLCLAFAAPASQPASQAISKDTRPELFKDEPPPSPALQGASQPVEAQDTSTWFWFKMLLRTVLVLGAVVGLAYLVLNKGLGKLMRLTGAGAARNITVIERMAITQKHSVVLVEVHGKRLLVGTTDNAIALLADLSDIAPPSAITVDKGTA